MEKNTHNFLESLKKLSMQRERKLLMREHLASYADMKPVRTGATRSRAASFVFPFFKPVAAFAALTLVFGGAGISFAAMGSVPGDILYPVKIAVSEPVERLLAFTSEQKMAVQVRQSARRVEETAILASRGGLSSVAKEEFQATIAAHPEVASHAVDALESRGYIQEAAEVRAVLASPEGTKKTAPESKVALTPPDNEDGAASQNTVTSPKTRTIATVATPEKTENEDGLVALIEQLHDAQIVLERIKKAKEPEETQPGATSSSTESLATPTKTVSEDEELTRNTSTSASTTLSAVATGTTTPAAATTTAITENVTPVNETFPASTTPPASISPDVPGSGAGVEDATQIKNSSRPVAN